jgi:DNA-binding FadR family transcriptional regulator
MRRLIADVVAGRLAAGEWLPREVDFADRYEVSRGVTRETIQALRERGLIDVRHGRGAWVLPEERWDLLDPDVLVTLVTRPDRGDLLAELLECRLMLAPDAAALAARRATGEDVEALAAARRALEEPHDDALPGFIGDHPAVRADAGFHDRLAAIAGNRPLAHMLAPVHVAVAAATQARAPERRPEAGEDHDAVIAAVRERDPEAAAEAVRRHIRRVGEWFAPPRARRSRRRASTG